jgi:predicted nucleic acid-binding protein
MRVAYVDTSVLAAIAFGEPEGAKLGARARALDRLYSSTLLEAEFLAAARREDLPIAKARSLLAPIRWIYPDRRLTSELETVLERGYVRGADLHHLATALFLFPNPPQATFLSLDVRQTQVAGDLGFAV